MLTLHASLLWLALAPPPQAAPRDPAPPPKVDPTPATAPTPAGPAAPRDEGPHDDAARDHGPAAELGKAVSTDSLTLPQLFEMLERHSPRLEVARAQRHVAEARRAGAKVLPNPIFNFQVLHLLSGYNQNGFGTFTIYFQQPLLIGGQRQQRRRAAQAAEHAVDREVQAERHDVAAEGRHLFVALQSRQEHHHVLEAAIADLERLAAVVTARHTSGVESRYDVARIGLEVRQWKAHTLSSTAEIRDVAGHLGVMIGRPRWIPHAEGAFEPMGISADAEKLWADVERTQPSLKAADARIALAERDLKATRREAFPQPTIGLGVVGIDNFFSMSALGGITMPLPVFDWGQGQVAKAKAEVRVAKVEKSAHTAELSAELDRVTSVLRERKRALANFETDVMSQTADLQRMAEDAYVTGQVEILELIDAVAANYEIRLHRVELIEQVMHAEVDVLHVLGRVEEVR